MRPLLGDILFGLLFLAGCQSETGGDPKVLAGSWSLAEGSDSSCAPTLAVVHDEHKAELVGRDPATGQSQMWYHGINQGKHNHNDDFGSVNQSKVTFDGVRIRDYDRGCSGMAPVVFGCESWEEGLRQQLTLDGPDRFTHEQGSTCSYVRQ